MIALASSLALWFAVAGLPHPTCPGDCDRNGATTEREIEVALRLVFDDEAVVATCAAADADANQIVSVAEILTIARARAELPEPCSSPVPTSHWVDLAPLAAGPRQEVGVAALGDSILVLGGFDDRGRGSALVERYDVAGDAWTRLADLPMPLQHVGAATAAGAVYCVGGFLGSTFTPTAEVLRYDAQLDEWNPVKPLPEARGALAVVELGGKLHALGGSAPGGSVTTHSLYDPATDEWSALAAMPGNGRNHLAAAVLDGMIYVVGGRPGVGESNSNRNDRYDPATDSWTPRAPIPTARSGHAIAAVGGRIVALGGEVSSVDANGVFPQVELYDPIADEWTPLEDMPAPRHGIGAVLVGPRIHVPGGAAFAGFGASALHDALEVEF